MAIQMNPSVILSAGNSVDSTEVSLDSSEIKLSDDITESEQGNVSDFYIVKLCILLYCIQGKFCPRFIFALFTLWPEGEFKPGPIIYKGLYKKIWGWANSRLGESVSDPHRAKKDTGRIQSCIQCLVKLESEQGNVSDLYTVKLCLLL